MIPVLVAILLLPSGFPLINWPWPKTPHRSWMIRVNGLPYRFSDYARVGALLDVLIVVTAVPMIMWVWLP